MTTQHLDPQNGDAEAPPSFWEIHSRQIFIVALFVVIFFAVRLTLKPINVIDYGVRINAIHAFLNGQSPYTVDGFYEPPWCIFIILPLGGQPLETWLALTVAFFVAETVDLGKPSGLVQLAHPLFITLLVSSNPEWIYLGPGLWLLYRTPKGWGRGLAWLFLTCKPQTTFFLLIFDGIAALRQRDWKAFALAGSAAVVSWFLFPDWIARLSIRMYVDWSGSVIYHYTVIGAIIVTVVILAIRWRRLGDLKTLGLILAPVWSPYTLEYSCVSLLFTLRKAGWLRNIVYLVCGLALVAVFWRDYHVSEHIAILGMILLAAIFAPNNDLKPDEETPAVEVNPQPIAEVS
ncbi:MAG: hypothetical protein ABI947_17070 [Chloroflexota bacterium]